MNECKTSQAVVSEYHKRAERRERRRKQKRQQSIVKVVVTIGTILFLAFIANGLYHGVMENATKYDYTETTQVVVHQGDTLWAIAKDYCDERHDVRVVVDEIEELSDTSAMLQIGQVLTVPLFDCMS